MARLVTSSTSASPADCLLRIARSFRRVCTLLQNDLASAAILLFGLRLLLRVKLFCTDGYGRCGIR